MEQFKCAASRLFPVCLRRILTVFFFVNLVSLEFEFRVL